MPAFIVVESSSGMGLGFSCDSGVPEVPVRGIFHDLSREELIWYANPCGWCGCAQHVGSSQYPSQALGTWGQCWLQQPSAFRVAQLLPRSSSLRWTAVGWRRQGPHVVLEWLCMWRWLQLSGTALHAVQGFGLLQPQALSRNSGSFRARGWSSERGTASHCTLANSILEAREHIKLHYWVQKALPGILSSEVLAGSGRAPQECLIPCNVHGLGPGRSCCCLRMGPQSTVVP